MQTFFYFLDHPLELGLTLPRANFGERYTKICKIMGECIGSPNEHVRFQTSL